MQGPTHPDRFTDEIENLSMEFATISSREEDCAEFSVTIAYEQPWRDAAADASHGAIAVHLAVPRVHDAEVAFRVHDLASERNGSKRRVCCQSVVL